MVSKNRISSDASWHMFGGNLQLLSSNTAGHIIPFEKSIYVQLSVFDRDFTLGGHIFLKLSV
jgi:hypothetical protein